MSKKIVETNAFSKDFKKVRKYQNFKQSTFELIIKTLAAGEKLDPKYKPHKMAASGVKYSGYMNCHVAPNICMIYDITPDELTLIRIGSHSDLGLTEQLLKN